MDTPEQQLAVFEMLHRDDLRERRRELAEEATSIAIATAEHFGERGQPVDWFPIEKRHGLIIAHAYGVTEAIARGDCPPGRMAVGGPELCK